MKNNQKKIVINEKINQSKFSLEYFIEKYGFWIFILVSFTASYIVFKDFITGNFLYFFQDIGSDSINITFPNYIQGINLQKSEGFFRTWTFYTGMGQSVSSSITLNPFPIFTQILQLIFGINLWYYRFFIYYFLYFLPIGILGFLYFKTLNYSKFTCIIGGLLLQFSGYLIVGSQWGHAHRLLYSVFLFFSFEQLLLKKRWIYFFIAFYLLSDNFFCLAVNGIFLFMYSIIRHLDTNDGKFGGYHKLFFKMAGFAILAVALNAPRALTNFLMMFESPRVSGNVNQAKTLIQNPEILDAYLRRVTTTLRFFGNDLLGSGSEFKGWYNYLEAALFYIGIISLSIFTYAFFFLIKNKKFFTVSFFYSGF